MSSSSIFDHHHEARRFLQNSSTQQQYEGKEPLELLLLMVWSFLLILCCVIPTVWAYRRRQLRQIEIVQTHREEEQAVHRAESFRMAMNHQIIQSKVRLSAIHSLLKPTTMTVETDDIIKRENEVTKTDIETGETIEDSPNNNLTEDDTEREFAWLQLPDDTPNGSRRVAAACAICLCPYDEGDSVTWSPQKRCQHAYHSECIEEWLARKENSACPCCRQEFCFDDGPSGLSSVDEDAEQQEATVEVQENAPSTVDPGQPAEAAPP